MSKKPEWKGCPGIHYTPPTAKDYVIYFLFATFVMFGAFCFGFFVLCLGSWLAS